MLAFVVTAALLAQVPVPSVSPAAVPSVSPTASPAPYKPASCSGIVKRAHLAGKPVNADNLGRLYAQALKDHGMREGVETPTTTIRYATLDFLGCFSERPR